MRSKTHVGLHVFLLLSSDYQDTLSAFSVVRFNINWMWQCTLADLANWQSAYSPVSAVGTGYYGRTDGRTWRILHFLANGSQTDCLRTARTSLSDITRQARTQTTFASVFDVPICSVRVRMREYSRDRSVETSRYTAQFPTSAQLRKLNKFDKTRCYIPP